MYSKAEGWRSKIDDDDDDGGVELTSEPPVSGSCRTQ